LQGLPSLEKKIDDATSSAEERASNTITHDLATDSTSGEKYATVLVYITAANDLVRFSERTLAQLKVIGSNERLNLLVHIERPSTHGGRVTRRYVAQRNKLEQWGADLTMDSGDESTLYDAMMWAKRNFPARHFLLFVWNHGAASLNLESPRIPSRMLRYDQATRMLKIDRQLLQQEMSPEPYDRGICYNYMTGHYLSEQAFRSALANFYKTTGKKIDLLCFDACFMGCLEVAHNIADYVDYMVASQEAELAMGIDYHKTLKPLAQSSISMGDFARHVVATYKQSYQNIFMDYTYSALDLSLTKALVDNLHKLSLALLEHLKHNRTDNHIITAMLQSRRSERCIAFEPLGYVDLHKFYSNMLASIDPQNERYKTIRDLLTQGLGLLSKAVVANVTGPGVLGAQGLSLYFPHTDPMHKSYTSIHFSQVTAWPKVVELYRQQAKRLKEKSKQ
jgi:hypothetical protein